jgi:predicted O-methyltransferase YrrM
LQFLYETGAPISVYFGFIKTYLNKKIHPLPTAEMIAFRKLATTHHFSNDWFTGNIPIWTQNIKTLGQYFSPAKIKALEIGSFEGMSALFILENFPNAQLTCVDTWEGADEHHTKDSSVYIEDFSNVVVNKFDSNLKEYQGRLTKYRGTSFDFLTSIDKEISFDLMYIDGSHDSGDVVFDAFLGFRHLNKGGIMIFDDYFWGAFYKKPLDNPAGAINAFLKLKQGEYKLIAVYGQLIIQKL